MGKIIFRVQANHETMESLHVTMNFIYINKNNECYFWNKKAKNETSEESKKIKILLQSI